MKAFSGTIQLISTNGSILEEWNYSNCFNAELDIRKYNAGAYFINVLDYNGESKSINKILILN
jgi:hypothetical protein